MRPEVLAFAELMEDRLKNNDHKGGWVGCDVRWLFGRLLNKVSKLHRSIEREWGDTYEETADVANFAMMICDVLGGLVIDGDSHD